VELVTRNGREAAVLVLRAPAALYEAAVRLRNRWFDRGASVRRAGIPVISVGNLAAGGTGKTPLVAWLAARVRELGRTPAIVSRGYGGSAGRGPLIVSTGDGPLVDARACGDEPFQLARSLPGVVVVVGSDRWAGARAGAAAGAGTAILDDGFQHRRLARDLDLVVLDGRAPFGNGRLIPAGPLREPPSSLRRADVVVLTRLAGNDPAPAAMRSVRGAGFLGPVVRAGHSTVGFATAAGSPAPAPARALAFCGIGDPELFRRDLLAAGTESLEFESFRDHHPYAAATWRRLRDRARSEGLALVTTEKDLARLLSLPGERVADSPLLVLRIESRVWDEAELLEMVRTSLASEAGGVS
jgi:tetraacyldisaccharide 4'-kinase